MIYLLLGGICACFGTANALGASTLLRPLLDAVSPLDPSAIAMLSTAAALCTALVSAFFALSNPLPLHQDELLLLAVGALLGGALGDLVSVRFLNMLSAGSARLLSNALLFTTLALPAVYFGALSRTIQPLSITRMSALPAAILLGLIASFLSFGAVPLTLMAYDYLFDAQSEESSAAALTVSLCAMAGKLLTLLIRQRLNLPNADILLWLLPGALLGTAAGLIPGVQRSLSRTGESALKLSLFAALINMASALA